MLNLLEPMLVLKLESLKPLGEWLNLLMEEEESARMWVVGG